MKKTYEPKTFESSIYHMWTTHNHFSPSSDGEPFCMVMPPPNVTGKLHMGHALNHTLQDILARWKRLQGHRVLWVPGTDHAGIATQAVVEKQLRNESLSRETIGREAFVQRVWEWKHHYGDQITNQIKRLGDSVDWTRHRFTLDDGLVCAVQHHFVRLYRDGLIYRGHYIVNWCPRCRSALSDIEVTHQDTPGHLWHIAYPITPNTTITVATTRPETLLGDQAIAVHPDDDRYRHMIGQSVSLPLCHRTIPIIADTAVDPTFGSGAVKVTPAHDVTDFEIGKRHDLTPLQIMDTTGHMTDSVPPPYRGLDRYACRDAVLTDLKKGGFLAQTDDYTVAQGRCYRCHTVIEPHLSNQWFVNMRALAKPAIQAVKDGHITFQPKRWTALYLDWMENIKDWCISRQIWWGHRLPVWYDPNDPDTPIVQTEPPPHANWVQDTDVLDTWFSSALWPFSTLGWPNKTADYTTFYPTRVLVTGYDIITFWVSRMITMGLYHTQKNPFQTVVVHGLVRDITGKKMSKSLGNVIDPIELIDEYGADALRFCLASHATLGGQDIRFSIDKVAACRNFANKLWNAARYSLQIPSKHAKTLSLTDPPPEASHASDQWIISQFYTTLATLNHQLTTYNFALATETLWQFTWHTFCDWYIEMSKSHQTESQPVLIWVMTQLLISLHPFMPFITESLWQAFHEHGYPLPKVLVNAQWPSEQPQYINPNLDTTFQTITQLIRDTRHLRQHINLKPNQTCPLHISGSGLPLIQDHKPLIGRLAKLSHIIDSPCTTPHIPTVSGSLTIAIPVSNLIDIEQEYTRLNEQLNRKQTALKQTQAKLTNDHFLTKAPPEVIDKIKTQQTTLEKEVHQLTTQLSALNG